MNAKFRYLLNSAMLALGLTLIAPATQATAISVSQSPLFLTISLPPNIVVLLDDSGSMAWGYAPDSMGGHAPARVDVQGNNLPATANTPTTTVISTAGTLSGTVIATCTGTLHHNGSCSTNLYNYSCSPSSYSLNGPTSGSSTSPTTTTCTTPGYLYTCPTSYTLNGGTSSGTSATPPSGDSCVGTTTYSCPTGMTLSGSGSSSLCSGNGYQGFRSVNTPDTYQYKSSNFNPLYYNPSIIYTPPYTATGTQYTTTFTTAYYDGFDTANGSVNLSTSYRATETYVPGSTGGDSANNGCNYFNGSGSCGSDTAQAAFYYTYTPTSASAVTNGCGSGSYVNSSGTNVAIPKINDDSCYTKVTVSSTSGPGSTDERQNFANWYSFYRTRHFSVVSSADVAFNSVSQTYRVAWINLHTCTDFSGTNCSGWDSSKSYDNRIGVFTGQHRTDFYNWLSRFPANNGTNLRQQLVAIGEYYKTSGVDSPYAFNPHVTDSPEYVCRPNYTIALTDGEWNEATSTLAVQPGNADSTAVTLPDGTAFTGTQHPYSDGTPINEGTDGSGNTVYSGTNTLADVAFHYWATNLRPDLGTSPTLQYMPFNKNVAVKDSSGSIANVTPYWNAQNDPAQWPHMVTFTVGLGLTTVLASPPTWAGNTFAGASGYNALVTGNTVWPPSFSCGDTGCGNDPIGNIYDLWHAAIDGRGEFFAADTPQDVSLAFNSLITRIQGRTGSSSAIAVNSTKLDSNTQIYQALFNSSDWSGDVEAFGINSNGSIGAMAWQASKGLPVAANRTIFTWDETANTGAGGGISFLWASLNATEQAALNRNIFGVADGNGSTRLLYLRGDQSNEQNNGGNYRNRNQILGDIVNSNPFYVGTQDFGFSTNTTAIPEGTSYEAFVTTKASRTAVLYVGANDGMLHAINAGTGAELFGYVPRGIYANLSALTDPTYVHQYYVDGSPESVDAYFGALPTWHSLLAGSTGAGARDVFLLDVTNPTSMTASNVVFDYDGATKADANMGYPIGQPSIARMHDGNWYMIWGNGVNSPNQHAVLYLYNINTGALMTFDTKAGSSTTPNGMSTPAPIDYDGDRVTDAIYAGDLLGNMWKIDVSSSNTSQWGFSFGTKSSPAAFFTATDANNNVQPITDRPQVGLSSTGSVMVYFGTGTYFQTGDNAVGTSPPVMSFYGLIDDKTHQVTRANLLQQFVVQQTVQNGNTFRVTTAYKLSSTQQGWFMDLNYPSAQGERVVSNAVIDNGRIIFTTLIPQGNACQFGGISFLMELNGDTGGQLTVSPFDVSGDGKINNSDFVTVSYTDPKTNSSVTVTVPVSGEQSNVGIIQTPAIISAGELEYKYFSGSSGSREMVVESSSSNGGRLSWQQLQ